MDLHEQTERRSGLPTGWLNHREFIRRVGKPIDPDWTGMEHLALPPSQQMAEFARIDDDEACAAYWHQILSGIDQVFSSAKPA